MTPEPLPLAGRRILVTGASAGIGAATLRACTTAGASVAGVARRANRLEELSRETGALALVADVADAAQASHAVAQAADSLGGLDGLVNCAGIMRIGTIEEVDLATWRAMYDVNVFGLLAVTRAALPLLRAAAPSDLINVSSMSGRGVPDALGGMYGSSKAAVNLIGDTLRRQLQGSGVRVSTVAPGRVETELRDSIPHGQLAARARNRPVACGLSADDVAKVIVRVLTDPPEVNQFEITVLPTQQAMD